MIRSGFALVALFLLSMPPSVVAQDNCTTQVLVSGYRSNNVLIYDGCTGEHLGVLDQGNRIRGPQAVRMGPDGLLYVVSELNNRVLRYDGQTLDFVDIFIRDDPNTPDDELRGLRAPTGFDFGPDGDVYLGGFNSNSVHRFDGQTGAFKAFAVSPNGGGLAGPDAGISFAPDGTLLVPGFDSNNLLQFDSDGGFLGSLDDDIQNPRMIVYDTDNNRMLVTAWGTGTIRSYTLGSGQFQSNLSGAQSRPTGMAFDVDGTLLVTSDNNDDVLRINANNGNLIETFIEAGSGGLNGATYVYIHHLGEAPEPVAELSDLYWVSGLGEVMGNSIIVDDAVETTGPVFGDDYDTNALGFRRWGSLQIDMTGCRTGDLSWDSRGGDSAKFGAGGYPVEPIAAGFGVMACEDTGFDNILNLAWVSGGWFGGSTRSGEGLMIDVIDEQRAFVTWFTYGKNIAEE